MNEAKAEGFLGSGNGVSGVVKTLVSGAGRAACGSECLHRHGCYLKRTFLLWVKLGTRFTALCLPQDSKCCILSNEQVGQVPHLWFHSMARVWVRVIDLTRWCFVFDSAHL